MCFNDLVLYCSVGPRLEESGVGVTLSRESKEERFAFFAIDNDAYRRACALGESKLCDGLVYYRENADEIPHAIFIELKSRDTRDAEQQLASAVTFLKQKLRSVHKEFSLHALVVSSGSAPKGRSAERKRASMEAGVPLHFKYGVKQLWNLRAAFADLGIA